MPRGGKREAAGNKAASQSLISQIRSRKSAFHFDMNYTNELNDDNKIICIRAIEIIQTNDSIHRLQILPSSAAFLKFSGPSATELTLDVSSTHNTSQITSDIRIFIADFI